MKDYMHKLRDHRDNLERISTRSWDSAWEVGRLGHRPSTDKADAIYQADFDAYVVASHYFHVIRYGS
jgi:hypothetical protein